MVRADGVFKGVDLPEYVIGIDHASSNHSDVTHTLRPVGGTHDTLPPECIYIPSSDSTIRISDSKANMTPIDRALNSPHKKRQEQIWINHEKHIANFLKSLRKDKLETMTSVMIEDEEIRWYNHYGWYYFDGVWAD